MQSIILIFMGLAGTMGLLSVTDKINPPEIKNPQELANYTNCEPRRIALWMKDNVTYHEQQGYVSGADVLKRKKGDCKAYAVLSHETLGACGVKNHIIQLTQKDGPGHVVTIFELADKRRGYINSKSAGIYLESKPWREIISEIDGGKWEANFVEE